MTVFTFKFPILVILIVLFLYYLIFPMFICSLQSLRLKRICIIVSTFIYIIVLLIGLYFSISKEDNYVVLCLVIDKKYIYYGSLLNYSLDIKHILINIVITFPFGSIYKLFDDKKHEILKFIMILGIFSMVEFLQFLLPVNRTFEMQDIVLNTLGVYLGYLYFSTISNQYNDIDYRGVNVFK